MRQPWSFLVRLRLLYAPHRHRLFFLSYLLRTKCPMWLNTCWWAKNERQIALQMGVWGLLAPSLLSTVIYRKSTHQKTSLLLFGPIGSPKRPPLLRKGFGRLFRVCWCAWVFLFTDQGSSIHQKFPNVRPRINTNVIFHNSG